MLRLDAAITEMNDAAEAAIDAGVDMMAIAQKIMAGMQTVG